MNPMNKEWNKGSGDQPTNPLTACMSSFTNFLLNRVPANKTPANSDADMAEVEAEQNSHTMVVYNSKNLKTPNNDVVVTSTNLCTPQKHVPD